MDSILVVSFLIYLLIVLILLVFNVMAIRHILKFRFRGDISMAILLGYIIVVAALIIVTAVSLLALSWS